jgi:glycosyltransferase involved in cell wall biosynthesis
VLNLSIIIPAKDEQDSIHELSAWISRVMSTHGLSYEAIFIDDGSEDDTWQKIQEVCQSNIAFKGLRFNRNFGKSAALHTGFTMAKGEVVITMDSDLQDSPDEIPELYKLIKEKKFHLVSGWKKKRHDPISKTLPSKFFNLVTRKLSGIHIHDFNCGLKAYQHVVVKNISLYGEMHRYIPLIAKWAGFTRITEKVVDHHERKYGKSKFGMARFMRGFLDLLTITFIGRFARRPMHFFGAWGVVWFLTGLVFTAKILWDKVDASWISKIIGVQLFLTGFIAELIARQSTTKKDYLIIEKAGETSHSISA